MKRILIMTFVLFTTTANAEILDKSKRIFDEAVQDYVEIINLGDEKMSEASIKLFNYAKDLKEKAKKQIEAEKQMFNMELIREKIEEMKKQQEELKSKLK